MTLSVFDRPDPGANRGLGFDDRPDGGFDDGLGAGGFDDDFGSFDSGFDSGFDDGYDGYDGQAGAVEDHDDYPDDGGFGGFDAFDDRASARDTRLDPDVVRPVRPNLRGADPRGLTWPVLALAAMLSAPALWRFTQGELQFSVLVTRFVVITLACVVVGEVVRRFFGPTNAPTASTEPATAPAPGGEGEAAETAALDPISAAALDAGLDPALALLATER